MSLTPAFRYISATELAAILKSAPGGAFRSWAVIDVRDSDFAVSDRGVRADVVLQCGESRDSPCQQTAVVVNVQPASSLVHPPLSLFGESQCLPSGPSVRRRQADMQGGNIVGAANYPSDSFITSLDDLVKRAQDVPQIVFHCALSQVRGPKAARRYAEARRLILKDEAPEQDILVLREGFTGFQQRYRDDSALVEKFNKFYHD
ncbi:uncharacterized protein EHS24_007936 [Apiotrichum porosum]|uniref:Rhodanese domain-containing protein n=1 Tax=Apiotrichum porosum TaxID=105984 RepID=A0A427XSE7_9TREE|nr:uncharacterized protein EHS24_007936 [Apiotrichum porosum]RSH81745.1 hypothetical protein EHS24_007936 [Apiotrichum porosum]